MFCEKCGNSISNGTMFCRTCGHGIASVEENTAMQQLPDDFRGKLHFYGRSTIFLVGIGLFSAGGLLDVLLNFGVFSLFSLIILALPISAFWLIFAASKTPSLPEKTLPALTLFKASVIIDLVVICIFALVNVILLILMIWIGSPTLAFILLIPLVVMGLYIFFYFRAVFKILSRIRSGLLNNTLGEIPEVRIFTIITYIRVGFAVLWALIVAAVASFLSSILSDFFEDIASIGDMFGMGNPLSGIVSSLDSMALAALFTIVSNAGIVICVMVLNQFNQALASSTTTSMSAYVTPVALSPIAPTLPPAPTLTSPIPSSTSFSPNPALVSTPPRMPIVFLLDTSISSSSYIRELNTSLNRFNTHSILDVAIIQFADSITVLQDFTPSIKPSRLIPSGQAIYSPPLREALRKIEDYTCKQLNFYKPWVILISGSRPSDNLSSVAAEVQALQNADKLRLIVLGVQGYNAKDMTGLTSVVFRQDGVDFTAFFNWISKCASAISQTSPGQKPQLPSLEGNVYREA